MRSQRLQVACQRQVAASRVTRGPGLAYSTHSAPHRTSPCPSNETAPIASWTDGDSIEGYVLLSRKERRQDRNGNSFLDLELTDASGSISGKAWSDSAALESDFEAHQFVAIRGQVKDYRGQLQVSVQKCRQANESDREHGFDEALLVPTTQEDIGELYARLESMLEKRLQHPMLRRLALETLTLHGRDATRASGGKIDPSRVSRRPARARGVDG